MNAAPRKVLVADDDCDVRHVLCEILDRAGYMVQAASHGEEALLYLKQSAYDLVLTDFQMPRMNGLQLLRLIHAQWPATPVIVLSGDPSASACIGPAGPYAWIRKPYDPQHLLKIIGSAVERSNRQEIAEMHSA